MPGELRLEHTGLGPPPVLGPHFTSQLKGQDWKLHQAGEGADCIRLNIPGPIINPQAFEGSQEHESICPFPQQRSGQQSPDWQRRGPFQLVWTAEKLLTGADLVGFMPMF